MRHDRAVVVRRDRVMAGCAEAGMRRLSRHGDGGIDRRRRTRASAIAPIALPSATVDAPPGEQTHDARRELERYDQCSATSIACRRTRPPATPTRAATTACSDPATFGITTDFQVTQIGVQVENCSSDSGGQVVTARSARTTARPAHDHDRQHDAVLATNARSRFPSIDLVGGSVNAPITATIPAGKKVFIEIDPPDGTRPTTPRSTWASTPRPRRALRLPPSRHDCMVATPTNISSAAVAGKQISLLMTVTGTY